MSRLRNCILVFSIVYPLWLTTPALADCSSPANAIVAENCLPGTPQNQWDVSGAGDATIQGFATNISVNKGQTISFKINTNASSYKLDIYRMGYYGGAGARLVATILPSAQLPQIQPPCTTDTATALMDCGTWAISAAWAVPASATSGIYFAKLTRLDTGGASHVPFIVRDDTGTSAILFKTSDTTWEAYNDYGGANLYTGGPGPQGGAYKVSYNRPFHTRVYEFYSWVFNAEYPMVRFLEANGYDVSYFTSLDADINGSLMLQHKTVLSVGHDEYWSGNERTNFENARAAGVHLGFFSGNEIFWKTRWEPSIEGSNTPNRTLVCYKETHANKPTDPLDPPTWTGTWRDPRFSPPGDGGRPENGLSGTIFMVNGPGPVEEIQVTQSDGQMRFWRNTAPANLTPGQTYSTHVNALGYEWDIDADNGFRPAGLFDLSTATYNISGNFLLNYGSTYGNGTATHHLTTYRHIDGSQSALVFSTGTSQWAWGLDANHDGGTTTPDKNLQQATVNLFADMGVQPSTLLAGLVLASASTDAVPPTSTITSPTSGSSVQAGSLVTITGTASDAGGGVVGGVEVSTDGGNTWHPAIGRGNWTYNWSPPTSGSATIKSRAVDDSGNLESPTAVVTLTIAPRSCPCSIWGSGATPGTIDSADTGSVELGVRFRSDMNGFIAGIRFYKASTNTGTHIGNLWTNTGTLLAAATFSGESASGWQQVTFLSPVAVTANTTYVASYFDPKGHYSADNGFFANAGVDNSPLHALQDGLDGANGVYSYGSASSFPASTFQSGNYWVDVVFTTGSGSTTPSVASVTPVNGATGVSVATSVTAAFNEAMDPTTVNGSTFQLVGPGSTVVAGTVNYSSSTQTATLQPSSSLAFSTTYTASVTGGSNGVKDLSGNPMSSTVTWSFTTTASSPPPGCPCSVWSSSTTPGQIDSGDATAGELGFRFRSDVNGTITGIRFYKSSANTGTHIGNLWTNTGTLLGSITFNEESSAGWQQANFSSPISVTANTTYVASYFTSQGHYSANNSYFTSAVDNAPLHGLKGGFDGPNGVYHYGTSSAFPNSTFQSSNYWVDVVFVPVSGTTPPTVTSVTPALNSSGAGLGGPVTATFSEPMNASTINGTTFVLMDPSNHPVPANVAYNAATTTATLTPTVELTALMTYTATVTGGSNGVHDFNGNALATDFTWSFTTVAAPPNAGPGGPILVISNVLNPFTSYYGEILSAEGLNEYLVSDISNVSTAVLANYDVVILGDMSLTSTQVSMLTTWVDGGGRLIAMHPDKQLAGLLGLTPSTSTLSNAYLLAQTSTGPGVGIVGESMQFHGPADLYTLSGASSFATLYSDASTPTTSPAVTLADAGAGQAAAFTYDLARSIVYTRQGNPAWSGQARDGQAGPIRSDDLYFGAASFDPEPDWVDLNKVSIPQADEQQRLLSNLILQMNQAKKPLPRFWYLPSSFKAAVVMTGDDHGSFYSGSATSQRFSDFLAASPAGCSVADWQCVRSTAYLFPQALASNPLTNSQAAAYVAQGFEVALHADSNPTCSDWTPAALDADYTNLQSSFAAQFPSVPASKTHRMHCIGWSDYDSQPQTELRHGIRLDTSYYYWPPTWVNNVPGLFTGSGMPMRFTDRNGNIIDVYQATTQMTDESGQSYPLNIDTLLDNAVGATGYYGAFVVQAHNDQGSYPGIASNVVASAQARGVPIVSAQQMLTWLDGRNSSSFGSLSWNGNTLSFTISVGTGARNLQAMLPTNVPVGTLTSIALNGAPVSFTTQTTKGVQYAFFSASAGSYQAKYGTGNPLPDLTVTKTHSGSFSQGQTGATYTITVSNGGGGATSGAVTMTDTLPAAGLTATAISGTGWTCTLATLTCTRSDALAASASYPAITLTVNLASNAPASVTNTATVSGGGETNTSNDTASDVTTITAVTGSTLATDAMVFKDNSAKAATITTPTFSTSSGNELMLAFIATDAPTSGTNTTVSTVTGAGLTWSLVGRTNVQRGTSEIWRAFASTSLTNVTVSATLSSSQAASMTVVTFTGVDTSGVNGSGAVGATGTGNGASGAPTASLVTTRNNAWVFGVGNDYDNATTRTPGANQNLVHQFLATATGDTYWVQKQNSTTLMSGTMVTINDTAPTTDRYNLSVIEILPATGATQPTFTISGTISGSGGNGATVTLIGTENATVTASSSGVYSFSGLANGPYTVTPSKTGFTFTPPNQPLTVNGGNATANFATQTFSISGNISGAASTGVTVALSGTATATATTDASGSYSFNNLANGSYTITPSLSGFTFTPPSQSATVSGTNVTGKNFTSVQALTMSGNVSGATSAGVTVTLSGTAGATTTTDASGNYSFTIAANGSYTITPSKTGFTFTPPSQNVTMNGLSASGINFTSATVIVSAFATDAIVFKDNSTKATTIVTAAFSTTSGNELLLAFISTDGPATGVNTVVNSVTGASLTWTLVKRTNVQRGNSEIWRAFASTALTNVSVTATLSSSQSASMTVVSFTGVDTSGVNGAGAVGAMGTGSGASSAPTASLVATRNNSWVFGVGNDWDNAVARTPGANQSLVHQFLAPAGDTFWVQKQNATTALSGTTVAINDTAPTTDQYNLTIVEVLPHP